MDEVFNSRFKECIGHFNGVKSFKKENSQDLF